MENLSIYDISIYLGILGFILLSFSFLSGMHIIKIKAKYRLHKRIGIIGFSAAATHALVMLYFFFFS